MLVIGDIDVKDIVELVSYQPRNAGFGITTIIRGDRFFARCLDGKIWYYRAFADDDGAGNEFDEAIAFLEKQGNSQI
jgi:hypothetical protein